jgi:energy-coupling factor transport system ATP-binding protein
MSIYKIGPFQYTFKKGHGSNGQDLQVKTIFCDETITISDRELVLISSPSGAGKSTLLLMLKGLIPEYASGHLQGEILYNGEHLSGDSFKKNLKKILFLFQNPFSQIIYPKVAEEFFFSMENFNFTHLQMDQKKELFNSIFNLEALWDKKTNELSNGECQRLVLASLMAIDPEVLLLDEPTAFLDTEAKAIFYQWLAKMKGTKTIIVVDHHLSQILPIADKVININAEGKITLGSLLPEILPLTKIIFPTNNHQGVVEITKVQFSLEHVFFHYEEQPKLLEDIHFKVSSGEIVILKGQNGRGKSTLFKVMAGILKPLKGKIHLFKNNLEVPLKNHYKEIGYVFQNPESHFFYDTIREELGPFEKNPRFKLLQESFLRGVDLDRSPFLLSEGEKRRLSILITVFLDKSIFLYDEPTFGQDQQSINMMLELITTLKAQGKAQMIISHDDEFINLIGDAVYDLGKNQFSRIK